MFFDVLMGIFVGGCFGKYFRKVRARLNFVRVLRKVERYCVNDDEDVLRSHLGVAVMGFPRVVLSR